MAGGSAPRYAPADPSLPPPWKALVDGNTGYIYYWNTETNVTQYEKPLPSSAVPPLPPGPPPAPPLSGGGPKSASLPVVASPDDHSGRPEDKRSSANTAILAGSNPSRGESMHTMVSPQHVSSSGNRFLTSGSHISGNSAGKFSENLYVRSSSNIPGQHHSVHLPDHHGRHMSEHHNRPMSEHHVGHMSDHNSRHMPDHHGGKILDHHGGYMPDHHGGHTLNGGSVTKSERAMSGSAPRSSGHGMPGGAMHVNRNDSSWGGSTGKHAHGSPVGILRGVPSTRSNQDGGGARGNVPKLAALPVPQRQQGGMGGMHYSDQPRQVAHLSSSSLGRSSLPITPVGAFKRTASDYPAVAPDLHKRPRLQAFSEPFPVLDVQAYRIQHEVTVVGENVPPPFMTFDAANLTPEIHKELRSAGFTVPTPIQAQSWPIAIQNRDIVAIAKTGSGKTLGYLLPAFLHLIQARANPRSGPIVLVLAPTRELATQIQNEAMKFGRSSKISSTCVYGGAPKGPQLRELERGADIVIATPGRLNDFLEVKKINLRQVSYLVLDEADRMLDMGFEPQIRKIVKEVPSRRQTLMFTATWPKEVRKIAADLLVNAVHVNIGISDELTANKAITQFVEMVQPYEKQRRLEQILRSQEPGSKIIIFCSTKKMCDQLARNLARSFGAAAIHGDKSQTERDYVLAQFKAGRSPILVATDVAARGLDVKDIRVVINYDFPTGVEDYVHRIGRTGRAGATGVAFTFFSEQDSKYARELVKILESSDQKVPLELRQFAGRSGQSRGRGRWHTGGMSVAEGLMDDRAGFGGRPISGGRRDGSMRVGGLGLRDGSLTSDGAGGLGYTDRGMGSRDRGRDPGMGSRGGSAGDRVGGMIGRDGRIGRRVEVLRSRVEGTAARGGGMGSRGEGMPIRGGDINEGMGIKDGGVLVGTRDGGLKISEGGDNDGWSDLAHDKDGWGNGQGDTRPGDGGRRGGGRRDGWGDGGHGDGLGGASGSRGSSGPSGKQFEQRGRIFDRFGDRARLADKSGRKDRLLDDRIQGDGSKKFGGAKEETRSSGGSYSRSPSKGWGGSHSRSPSKGWGGSHSRSPSKGWRGSRSRSPSPSKVLGGSHSHSPSRGWGGKHSRSPSHGRRFDDRRGWSGSPYQGDELQSRSPASPRGCGKAFKQASQPTSQATEHGKASKDHRNAKQPTLPGKVSKENKQANQLTLPETEHTSSFHSKDNYLSNQVTAPSVDGKPGTAVDVHQTISPGAGVEITAPSVHGKPGTAISLGASVDLLDEITSPSKDSKLDISTRDSQLFEHDLPDEGTEMNAHSNLGISTTDSHVIEPHLLDHVATTEQLLSSSQAISAHEQHPLYQATTSTEINEVDFAADENHMLYGATTTLRQVAFRADQDTLSDQVTVPKFDSSFAIVDIKPDIAKHGLHISENHLLAKGAAATEFVIQNLDLSENHINDGDISSPEEGMVL